MPGMINCPRNHFGSRKIHPCCWGHDGFGNRKAMKLWRRIIKRRERRQWKSEA